MPRRKATYTSLIIDENFSDITMNKVRRLIGFALAEMLGTAFFVGLGCSSTTNLLQGAHNTHLNTAIAFALGVATSIIVFGPISGALMNPALNIVLIILGHMSVIKGVFYTLFQLLGAYLGVLAAKTITPEVGANFCMTLPNPEVSTGSAFFVEFVTSAMLAFGLCNAVDKRQSANHSIIFVKFLVIILAIAMASAKYSGCSMNPARSFGPALLAGNWEYHWIYWVATCLGAAVAAVLYRMVFAQEIFEDKSSREEVHSI
ncbi:aquaporin AQPAn.G-like isoform X1 [Cimex lectularius]|uniref:Aquaglyceroporin 2 n=1 Tax=Cimex lectularius TaxID=79782 RepID=A0A165Y537_CIMLE|nr:aquaporin AQPAn.G-like isoform X1 [Cimex lectularius]AMZ04830.1 aquaglyceroporin 2 [Cimex lectularius]